MHLVLQQRSVLGEGVVAQARLQLQRNEHLSKDGAVHQARPTPADLQRGLVCHVEVEAVLTNGLQIRVVLCHSIPVCRDHTSVKPAVKRMFESVRAPLRYIAAYMA
eukprot:scaffold415_cov362-Prasinococcus_capsulatus_cf.AAC.20